MTRFGLGRRPERKPEQNNFLLSSVMGPRTEDLPLSRMWKRGQQLDQGNTGTCVGHGFAHRMMGSPVRRAYVDPFEVYRLACTLDPWFENDGGDLNFGTSVDAGAQAALKLGLIDAFFWSFTLAEAEEFVLTRGPLVIGTGWTDRMFEPERVEVLPGVFRLCIKPGIGEFVGGHCYVLDGRNRTLGTWRVWNSWGLGWGNNGGCMIQDEDLQYLLDTGGEFCWPREVVQVASGE